MFLFCCCSIAAAYLVTFLDQYRRFSILCSVQPLNSNRIFLSSCFNFKLNFLKSEQVGYNLVRYWSDFLKYLSFMSFTLQKWICVRSHYFKLQAVYNIALTFTFCFHRASASARDVWELLFSLVCPGYVHSFAHVHNLLDP